jgi:hypothetical protein
MAHAATRGAAAVLAAICSAAALALPAGEVPARLVGVELDPIDPSPGGQFVWVLNRGSAAMALGCYRVRSAATRTTFVVYPHTSVPPHAIAVLAPRTSWLRSSDRVQLLDPRGRLIDETPRLRDRSRDDRFWVRTGRGWRFGRGRAPSETLVLGRTGDRVAACRRRGSNKGV